jgi:transposase InsO family protein
VIHSDQGTQFTSWAFTRRAVDSGLLPSMGSKGDCYDNAMIESFWSRMQVELLDRQRWRCWRSAKTGFQDQRKLGSRGGVFLRVVRLAAAPFCGVGGGGGEGLVFA